MPINQNPVIHWITIQRASELTGLTVEAIRNYRKKGQIRQGYHWVKKGRRLFIHAARFSQWLEGREPVHTLA
jgi:hypothetical protein